SDYIKEYNQELLSITGSVSRAFYEGALHSAGDQASLSTEAQSSWPSLGAPSSVDKPSSTVSEPGHHATRDGGAGKLSGPLWSQQALNTTLQEWAEVLTEQEGEAPSGSGFMEWASTLLRAHGLAQSQPHRDPGIFIGDGFFGGGAHKAGGGQRKDPPPPPPSVPSTTGVRSLKEVMIIPTAFRGLEQFIDPKVPLIPASVLAAAPEFFAVVERRQVAGMPLAPVDMVALLGHRRFGGLEGLLLLRWYLGLRNKKHLLDTKAVRTFQESLRLSVPTGGDRTEGVTLAELRFHAQSSRELAGLPLPRNTLPLCMSQHLSLSKLKSLLGLRELPMRDWWQHLVALPELETAQGAPLLLGALARCARDLRESECEELAAALAGRRCIPAERGEAAELSTRRFRGMFKPGEVYLLAGSSAERFQDLPQPLLPELDQAFLKRLGVREEPDVAAVIERREQHGWSWRELLQYFFARSRSAAGLQPSELSLLRAKMEDKELYLPIPELKQLGFSVLPWQEELTPELQAFLRSLGVRDHAPLANLLELAAGADSSVREAALGQLLRHRYTHYKDTYPPQEDMAAGTRADVSECAFVPASDGTLHRPLHIFIRSNPFDFPMLHPKYKPMQGRDLGLRLDAPMEEVAAKLLARPPWDDSTATEQFTYLGRRIEDLREAGCIERLQSRCFIPLEKPSCNGQKVLAPPDCFPPTKANKDKYGLALDYTVIIPLVDGRGMATPAALFLRECGVK
ncbi:hypothetical protein CYMTET_36156, partial [Cymbomonas tetramitiformis]